jgi:tetratricopeptide (TPR) repeat protein
MGVSTHTAESNSRQVVARDLHPRSGRLWCIPPGLVETGAGLPGQEVLQENPDDLGLLLWQCLRDVQLWAATAPEGRLALFSPLSARRRAALGDTLDLDPGIAVAAGYFTDLVDAPARAAPALVQAACAAVAEWAEARGNAGTAVQFAVAGAEADPTSGSAALLAGSLARRCGRRALAEAWLLRALALSRRGCAWGAYSNACLELGRLWRAAGSPERARRMLTVAARAARRYAVPDVRGPAALELFRLAAARGDDREAERHQRAALRAIRPRHPAGGAARNEIAGYWLELRRPDLALPLLREIPRGGRTAAERIRTLTLVARAVASLGDRESARSAWDDAIELVMADGETPATARRLVELARAVAGVLAPTTIREAAWRAAHAARSHGQADLEAQAMSLLQPDGTAPSTREPS